MLEIKFKVIILPIILFSFFAVARSSQARELTLRGDPNFSATSLNPEMKLWHDRLWNTINNPNEYPNIDSVARTNDVYGLGRTLQDYIIALMFAFRATGDLGILDEADRLMQMTRANLADTNGDGYLNWIWWFAHCFDPNYDPDAKQFCGKDNHMMDEIMSHTLVSMMAYAYQTNADFHPKYAERSTFWENYLINHFFPKWQARGGLNKTLTHPYISRIRLNSYAYKLTGNQAFLQEALTRENYFFQNLNFNSQSGGAFAWTHNITQDPDGGTNTWGIQNVGYGSYTTYSMIDLHLEKFSNFASDNFIQRLVKTYRDKVYIYNTGSMACDVSGYGKWMHNHEVCSTNGTSYFVPYNNGVLARWDDTGTLHDLLEAFYEYIYNLQQNQIYIPASMLVALAPRSDDAIPPAIPSGLSIQ